MPTSAGNKLNEERYLDIINNYNPDENRGYSHFAKKWGVSTQRIKQIVLKARDRGDLVVAEGAGRKGQS